MTGGLSRRQLLKLGALAPAAVALSGLHLPAAAAATTPAFPSVVPSRKKGVGVAHTLKVLTSAQSAQRVLAMKPAWYYTWSATGFDEAQDVEFVPMVWGARPDLDPNGSTSQDPDPDVDGTDPDSQAAKIQAQVDAVRALGPGKRPIVLGFNEPDNAGQSNMSVDEALEFWPEVSDLAALTVSPAPTHPLPPVDTWFTEFFARARELGLRFHYMAVHNYPGGNAQGDLLPPAAAAATFLDTIDQVFATYGLPIWVTEFALADWGAKAFGGGSSRYKQDEALEFMQAVLPELERRPHVARYAWYGAGPAAATSAALGPSALFDSSGDITRLGEFYAQFATPAAAAATAPVQAGGAGR